MRRGLLTVVLALILASCGAASSTGTDAGTQQEKAGAGQTAESSVPIEAQPAATESETGEADLVSPDISEAAERFLQLVDMDSGQVAAASVAFNDLVNKASIQCAREKGFEVTRGAPPMVLPPEIQTVTASPNRSKLLYGVQAFLDGDFMVTGEQVDWSEEEAAAIMGGPDGPGCFRQAQDSVDASLGFADFMERTQQLSKMARGLHERTEADKALINARESWQRCMADKGHNYVRPEEVSQAMSQQSMMLYNAGQTGQDISQQVAELLETEKQVAQASEVCGEGEIGETYRKARNQAAELVAEEYGNELEEVTSVLLERHKALMEAAATS